MKIQIPALLMIMILFATIVHKSSCRSIVDHSVGEERIRANFISTFKRHFNVNPKLTNGENQLPYVVSHRLVPCGPNPLHNWPCILSCNSLYNKGSIKPFCIQIYTHVAHWYMYAAMRLENLYLLLMISYLLIGL